MARRRDLSLNRDFIAEAGLSVFRRGGVGAVSTRKVAAEIGASPMSLYVHVRNKEGLLDAIVERLMRSIKADLDSEAPWTAQADQWAHGLRRQLLAHPGVMELLRTRRWAFIDYSEPLIRALLGAGFSEEEAVRATRLLTWSTVGFLGVETGVSRLGERERPGAGEGVERTLSRLHDLEGGGTHPVLAADARGVDQRDIDALFSLQTRLLVEGLASMAASSRDPEQP